MIHGKALLTMVMGFVLVSCSGGGDGTPPPSSPTPLTGAFIDSPVQGLPYSSSPSGLSGKTGPKGEFQYRANDEVTFTFGTQRLLALGQPIMTPFTLLAQTSVPDVRHEWPVNLAQYLLGINTTPGSDSITLPATLPSLPATTCFVCPNFEAAAIATGIPLVSKAAAIAHLQRQFSIWGSWATATSPTELRVITFLPNGIYLLADDDSPVVAGGNDGMERGTYSWNPNTNVFTYAVAVNTDGTGGLSNSGPAPYTFVIDGSGDAAVLHLGPNVSDEIHLTRVTSSTNLLVGGWKLESPADLGFSAVLTLLSDGTFTVASDAIDTAPAGMERGTYIFDSTTGTLTLTTTVDTNGAFGINDPASPGASAVHAEITQSFGWDLDFLHIDDAGDLVIFDRIKTP